MGLTTALQKTQFLPQLAQLGQTIGQTMAQQRAVQVQQMQNQVIGGISDMFLSLPSTTTEADVRATMIKANQVATATNTTEMAQPLIAQLYKDRIEGIKREEERTQDSAYAKALTATTGFQVPEGMTGKDMTELIKLQQPELKQVTNDQGQSYWQPMSRMTGLPMDGSKVVMSMTTQKEAQLKENISLQGEYIPKPTQNMTSDGIRVYSSPHGDVINTVGKDGKMHQSPYSGPLIPINQAYLSDWKKAQQNRLEATADKAAVNQYAADEDRTAQGLLNGLIDPNHQVLNPNVIQYDANLPGTIKNATGTLSDILTDPARKGELFTGLQTEWKDNQNEYETRTYKLENWLKNQETIKARRYDLLTRNNDGTGAKVDPKVSVTKALAITKAGITDEDFDSEVYGWKAMQKKLNPNDRDFANTVKWIHDHTYAMPGHTQDGQPDIKEWNDFVNQLDDINKAKVFKHFKDTYKKYNK